MTKRMASKKVAVRFAALGVALSFCGVASAKTLLTASKAGEPPKLEALAADPAWAKTSELKL